MDWLWLCAYPITLWMAIMFSIQEEAHGSEVKNPMQHCKWKQSETNTKLRAGINAGVFHHLGFTPTMKACIDLCCQTPVCEVAFKSDYRCYGIECVSDEACTTIQADGSDAKVEIAHIRAGQTEANTTDVNLAGQCHPSQIYNEVTLKGGINAGTYKDVGGVSTMQECQKKCCEFPACDLSLMLAGSCYLVGCSDQKSCVLQPAKKSNFHPSVSYVTRWNSEGVKHTVFVQDKSIPKFTCPKMVPINKVTLKGGLQAGGFTDVGKVANLEQCYDICCQQEHCDLAFMLGQNCFSVQCKDKTLCTTIPAQPSIFNPQIAYVASRLNAPVGMGPKPTIVTKSNVPATPSNSSREMAAHVCPDTKIMEKVTLKGGVDAGNFHDNGKVEDMKQCRRICCEMTHCHLAFLLGKNCFSVKCSSVDACRAQTAKPSTFYPQISYVRKVGTNELLKPIPAAAQKPAVTPPKGTKPLASNTKQVSGGLGDSRPNPSDGSPITDQLAKLAGSDVMALPIATQDMSANTQAAVPSPSDLAGDKCDQRNILHNVTLKGGKKSGEFKEVPSAKTMDDCITRCCDDATKKCNLAFMLGTTCYSVECKSKDLCQTMAAPPSSFNPQIAIVRQTQDGEIKGNASHEAVASTKPTTSMTSSQQNDSGADEDRQHCMHSDVVDDKSLRDGKKAGKYRLYRGIPNMEACIAKCCMNDSCDVAFMEGGRCFNVACFSRSSCTAVSKQATDVAPQIAYMQHYLDQPDVEDVPLDKEDASEYEMKPGSHGDIASTDKASGSTSSSPCSQVEVAHNISIKPGAQTGVMKEVGHMTDMSKCIGSCCDRPDCDIAYLLNGRCYSVQCSDGQSCQTSTRPAEEGDEVQLAYMNKLDTGEKQRDMVVVYMIAGCLAFAATAGGLLWAIFAFVKRRKLRTKRRLLDEDEERIDDMLSRPTHTRYRTPHARY